MGEPKFVQNLLAGVDYLQIVAMLLAQDGINVNMQNELRKMPLHCAIDSNEPKLLDKLFAHAGIQVNLQDIEGNTPLHYAVGKANLSIVKMLLDHQEIRG